MLYVLKLHALMALGSLTVTWIRGALSFQGRDDLASAKPALIANAATSGLLLLSAVVLMFNAGQYPFVDAWLTEKLIWLVAYIVLSIMALKPALPVGLRVLLFAAASMAFAFAYASAKHHLGIFLN